MLVLLPTDLNQLLLQWQGPFTVIEKVRSDDYCIAKTCHANMLKKCWVRENIDEVSVQEISAVVFEAEQDLEDEMSLYWSTQTESF